MPVSILMLRRGEILVPASQMDADLLTDIEADRLVDVTISSRVPRKLARLYWATLSDLGKGTGTAKDAIHGDLMRRTGRVDAVYVDNLGNVVRVTPRSTAAWDGIDWRAYIDEAWPIILSEILPGVHEPTFRRQIEKRVGITFEEARAEP
jgi:hypothetical protein